MEKETSVLIPNKTGFPGKVSWKKITKSMQIT